MIQAMKRQGLTLFETVIVVSIILLLTAILLPVLARSKDSAHQAADLSSLRQLALAGQLYHQQHNEFPASASQLLPENPALKSVLVSKQDVLPDTYVQFVKRFTEKHNPSHISPEFRASFVGLGDYLPVIWSSVYPDHFNIYSREVWNRLWEKGQTPGWLVSFMPQMPSVYNDTFKYFKGPVDRLTSDGGVVRRPNCMTPEKPAMGGVGLCLFDLDAKTYKSILDEASSVSNQGQQ